MDELNFPVPDEIINTPSGESGPEAEKIALASISYLWKLNDPEWVAQRDLDWQHLVKVGYHDVPKAERKIYELYFKRGEKETYIPAMTLVFLTPYTTIKELKLLFNSQLLTAIDREHILSNYIFLSDDKAPLSWYQQHKTLVIEGLLGKQYRIIREADSAKSTTVISPEPTIWALMYVSESLETISANKGWSSAYQCTDYFICVLPFAVKKRRKFIQLSKLLSLVDEAIAKGQLNGRALIFAQALKAREQDILAAWEIGEQKIAASIETRNE